MVSMRGKPTAVRRGYRLIHERGSRPNWPSPEAPWVIVLQHGRYSGVWVTVCRSDGYTFPNLGYAEIDERTKCFMGMYLGGPKSQFQRRLPEVLQYRDTMNLIFALGQRRAKVTEEQVKAITDPHLRLKLVEAACLAAVA